MQKKQSLFWCFLFACLTITSRAYGQEAAKAVASDLCTSPRLEEVLAAIECKRKSCPDPDGSKDGLYVRACTEVDPEAANILPGINSRDDGNFNTLRTVLRRVNDSYDLIEVLEVTRVEKPVKTTTLEPCDCLAKIAARTQCKVELCPKETQAPPPVNSGPANEPRPEQAGKDVVPERTASALQGGSFCALNLHGVSVGSGLAWLALLAGIAGLWIYRRRRIQ